MTSTNLRELGAVAAVIPVVSLIAVWLTRKLGRWFILAITRSFAETVREVMADDLAHLRTRLGTSIDELRTSNTNDHTESQRRLESVEHRLTAVEQRLAGVESRLPQEHPHD